MLFKMNSIWHTQSLKVQPPIKLVITGVEDLWHFFIFPINMHIVLFCFVSLGLYRYFRKLMGLIWQHSSGLLHCHSKTWKIFLGLSFTNHNSLWEPNLHLSFLWPVQLISPCFIIIYWTDLRNHRSVWYKTKFGSQNLATKFGNHLHMATKIDKSMIVLSFNTWLTQGSQLVFLSNGYQ